eukprot:m.182344 g.182344  ORF g.182344 m.182344 type:complete len:84 (-) comp16884_c1_seq6:916-1167(-)
MALMELFDCSFEPLRVFNGDKEQRYSSNYTDQMNFAKLWKYCAIIAKQHLKQAPCQSHHELAEYHSPSTLSWVASHSGSDFYY